MEESEKSGVAREIEVEVLPKAAGPEQESPLLKFLAVILDDLFLVPGTKIRVGLDPILGLFPGFGDTTTNVVSAVALLEVAKRGIPRIVMARMALNILINALGGTIPVAGDVFSAWFKSNRRNYELLMKHVKAGDARVSTRTDWIFVIGLVSVLVVMVLVIAFIAFAIFVQMVRWVGAFFGA
jgi:hypothetical protein